jgi:hypothetical protein
MTSTTWNEDEALKFLQLSQYHSPVPIVTLYGAQRNSRYKTERVLACLSVRQFVRFVGGRPSGSRWEHRFLTAET